MTGGRPTGPEGSNAGDLRPIVARGRRQLPLWVLAGMAVVAGVLLFVILDGQRRAATAPTTQVRTVDRVNMPTALPPLYLPPEPPPPPPPPGPEMNGGEVVSGPAVVTQPPPSLPPAPPIPNYPAPAFAASPSPTAPVTGQRGGDGPVLVIDTTQRPGASAADGDVVQDEAPVRPTRLRRPATTVPRGTLIPAVLETAIDSTRPGQVRAIVSDDITGFDGSRVLIPRGSRLFGEYQSEMAPGQNRVLVQWTRLVRPDGVSIAIASPAADLQGRAGVEGRVDNHFLERFGGALLQSIVNLGTAVATRRIEGDGPVILAIPGGAAAPATTTGSGGQPTLRVDAGARVGVIVAHDLQFSSGEARR